MGADLAQRGSGQGRYWKVRIALEALKASVWIAFQWIRYFGLF